MMAAQRMLARSARVASRQFAKIFTHPVQTKAFLGYVLGSIALYEEELALRDLPERRLNELFPGIDDQIICMSHRHDVWTLPYGEAFVLAALAAYCKPRRAFEVGTYTGAGTAILAQHSPTNCSVFTLDLPAERLSLPGMESEPQSVQAARVGVLFRGKDYASKVCQLYGDSATFDFSAFAGQIDLVLIDAVHTYEYVRSDTLHALEMLSPTGTIVWDDCSAEFPGVAKALKELQAQLGICRILGTRLAVYTRGCHGDNPKVSANAERTSVAS